MKFHKTGTYIPEGLLMTLEARLDKVVGDMKRFFSAAVIPGHDGVIRFYLAGSCIKSDRYQDIDMIFNSSEERDRMVGILDKSYLLYINHSHSYRHERNIFQVVFFEKYRNQSLQDVVTLFDFSSTKIGFHCTLDLATLAFDIVETDVRKEFVDYLETGINLLHTNPFKANPFVSLQRAINFLKRGDDVPYTVFLRICIAISHLDVKSEGMIEKLAGGLIGEKGKLLELEREIAAYLHTQKDDNSESSG